MSHTKKMRGNRRHARKWDNEFAPTYKTRGCDGKIKYGSKGRASGAVRVTLADNGGRPGMVLQPYKCRACRLWHIGNSRARS